ncbi:MAG: hypothetical protein V1773_04030 [bacterium]
MNVKDFFNIKPILFFIIFLVLSNLCVQFVPILDTIGYEFAVFNSILLFIIAGLSTLRLVKTNKDNIFYFYKLYLFYFSIPLLFSLFNSFIYGAYFIIEGLFFYILIVFPSILLSISIAVFIYTIFTKFNKTTFLILFFLLFIPILLEYYFYPQIYFYNAIISYFPGTIYDEEIPITLSLILYRIIIVIFSIIVLFISSKVKKNIIKKFYAVILVSAVVIIFVLLKPLFGFATNEARTLKTLSSKIVTKHFVVNFSNRIKAVDKERIAKLHEYYYERIEGILHFAPSKKIKSFIYFDADEKGLLFGSKAADVSKPWLYQIYINYQSLNSSLQHEIVHSFSAEIGVTPLKVANSFNAALIEGFAMAIDDSLNKNNIDYFVFLAKQNGYNITIKGLFSNFGFFSNYSGLSYYFAGSFIKFLISNYGIEKVIDLYRNLDIKKTYNKSIETLEDEYLTYLDKKRFIPNKYTAKYYFGYKPFIKKNCPRYEVKRINDADNLFERNQYLEAKEIYTEIYNNTNSYNSLYGIIMCLAKENNYHLAHNLLDKEIDKFYNSSSYFNLKYVLGEIYLKLNNYDKSLQIFNELVGYEISESYTLSALQIIKLIKYDFELANNFILSSTKVQKNLIEKVRDIKLKKGFYYLFYKKNNSFFDSLKTGDFDKNEKYIEYNLYLVSEKLFQLNKYNLAREFIIESILLNKNKKNYCLYTNQLRKINWFINYCGIN